MEEDIKILEEFIDDFKQLDENTLEEIKPTQFGEGQRYVYSDVYYAIENLIKINKELEEKVTKIENEVNDTLAFEKFLLRKDRKPDEFNEGRFYVAQIIKDILNGEKEPSGKHKENKYITEMDYISKSKIKEKIEELLRCVSMASLNDNINVSEIESQVEVLEELL